MIFLKRHHRCDMYKFAHSQILEGNVFRGNLFPFKTPWFSLMQRSRWQLAVGPGRGTRMTLLIKPPSRICVSSTVLISQNLGSVFKIDLWPLYLAFVGSSETVSFGWILRAVSKCRYKLFCQTKRLCFCVMCVWNWAEWRGVLKSRSILLRYQTWILEVLIEPELVVDSIYIKL